MGVKVNKIKKIKRKCINITIDDDSGCGAPPLGHDVLGYAGVVSGIRQTSLFDDQVVVDGDVKVTIVRRVDDLFVLQPLDLHAQGGKYGSESAPGAVNARHRRSCGHFHMDIFTSIQFASINQSEAFKGAFAHSPGLHFSKVQ